MASNNKEGAMVSKKGGEGDNGLNRDPNRKIDDGLNRDLNGLDGATPENAVADDAGGIEHEV
jgi:hypothetical protein